ncbi:MAG: hypothetical protein H6727_01315 [Myxococcales bacterium]|nr:hypothetical protein [Myxococcales bacterium]
MSQDAFAEARKASSPIAQEIAKKLALKSDEVSILISSADGSSLRFLYPEALFKTGIRLPTDRNSLAGQTIYYKKPQVHNNMTQVKHMAFFERVKTSETSPIPIQKMLTIPIRNGDAVIAIVQCSRKAKTLDEAGPDFHKEDIPKIADEIDEISMMLSLLRPEDF